MDGMIDRTDGVLLQEIQKDAGRSNRDLAEIVKLSPGAVHKRLKRLKEQGAVRKTTALLDRQGLELDLLCFPLVR
ncbi:MAG: winged helix-turn-helix transcriptional regulator [Deinococcota bacterium]|nr:winged helix-turn-helix transcriptional regulator [Deinococcota bacterium]